MEDYEGRTLEDYWEHGDYKRLWRTTGNTGTKTDYGESQGTMEDYEGLWRDYKGLWRPTGDQPAPICAIYKVYCDFCSWPA